jgi:hypothetical protein
MVFIFIFSRHTTLSCVTWYNRLVLIRDVRDLTFNIDPDPQSFLLVRKSDISTLSQCYVNGAITYTKYSWRKFSPDGSLTKIMLILKYGLDMGLTYLYTKINLSDFTSVLTWTCHEVEFEICR